MSIFDRFQPVRAALAVAAYCVLAVGCTGSSTTGGKPSEPAKQTVKSTEPGKTSVKANFAKVKARMSEKAVLDILGTPTKSVTSQPTSARHDAIYSLLPTAGTGPLLPVDPKAIIKALSEDDKPDEKRVEPKDPAQRGFDWAPYVVKTWDEDGTTYVVVFVGGVVWTKGPAEREQPVTKENADKIKVGMTKAEVETIVGIGEVKPEAEMKDFDGTVMVWQDFRGGMLMIGFIDDKVAAAPIWKSAEAAAKDAAEAAAKITKTNFDKIKVGMTKAQVEGILGQGKAKTKATIPDFSGKVIVWDGVAGSVTIGFMDDKVAVAPIWRDSQTPVD
jgi:outer membrane protein assembly factor BamE (lipoprotein component of BamABCDE complex)